MMMRRSGISYLMSHHRLGLCKGNKFSHTLKQRHRRQPRPRPDWDDTIHDLSIFKLSEAQLEARTKLFRCRHLHRSRSSFGKGRCFSVSKEQPDLSNASNKSEDAKAIFVAENRTDSVLSQSNPIVPKENVEVKAEIMAKDEKNFHQTKGYDKAFDLANNQENTKVMVSYKKNRCKSLPFIPRLKILRIQALPPSERYQGTHVKDGTGAQNHPNFGLLTEHGLSATSTPTVDFEDEIRCFEVCKGVIPCSEQGAQCNLTGDAKVCKNGKYGSSCSIKRSQYGMFSKMASYKQEGVFRQKKQDIFKCVRKLGEQEPSKKDKGQRARCANATCSKSYKRYVANSTRKELDNVNSKEPNIAKRYFGFIQRTIPTGECKVNAEKSQDTCALSKIELRYLRQEIRMYLKGQMDLLKEFKDFKSVIAFKLENIQSEIQRLSKIQLEPTDCRDKLMDTEKKNPTSLDQPLKEIDGHLEDGMQPQGKKLVLVAKESISPHVSCEPSCDVAFVKKVEEIQHADPPKPREIPEFLRWRNSNQKSMSAKLRQRVPCGTPKVISMNGMHSPHRTCSDSITDIFDSQLTPSISSKENPGHSTENEVMPPKYVASLQGIHRGGTSEESSVMSSFSSWFSGSCCDSQNDWKGKTNTRFQDMRDRNFKLQSSKIETAGCKDVNREYGACESSRTMTSQNNDKAKECESSHNNTTDHCHYWPHETTRDNGATLAMNFVKGDNDVAQAKKLGVVSISDLSLDKIVRSSI